MNNQLRAALAARYPTLKKFQIDKAVDKYTSVVIAALANQLSMGNIEAGEIDFPCDPVRAECGRIVIDKKRQYIFTIMQEHSSTKLVHVVYEGNNITHEVSKVIINPRFKKDVFEAFQRESLLQELDTTYLDALEAKANWDIYVDVRALDGYIKATRASMNKTGHHENYYETLAA